MGTLQAIHRYLRPERYDDAAEPREWDADTLDEVARMVDAAIELGEKDGDDAR